jgi:hypothetical protein
MMNDETWKMGSTATLGSTAAPAVAIGTLADGASDGFARVFQSSARGRAEQRPGRARSPIHPRFGENCVR